MNVVVLSQPRTGSNFLLKIFLSFIPFRQFGELYLNQSNSSPFTGVPKLGIPFNLMHHYFKETERLKFFQEFNVANVEDLVKSVCRNPEKSFQLLENIVKENIVIKVQDYMLNDLKFLLDHPNTYFVVLERKDKLKQFASQKIAGLTNIWERTDTSHLQISIDPKEFLIYKNNSINWYTYIEDVLKEKGHNFLKLYYEDNLDIENYSQILDIIQDWMKDNKIVHFRTSRKSNYFVKQNKSPIEQVVINYNELKETIC